LVKVLGTVVLLLVGLLAINVLPQEDLLVTVVLLLAGLLVIGGFVVLVVKLG
jgi:hypothetical protein